MRFLPQDDMFRLKDFPPIIWIKRARKERDSRRAEGFSILTVVLSLALLASITVGFTSVVQNRTNRIANEVRLARGELLAEAAVEIAMTKLLKSLALPEGASGRIAADATPVFCAIEDQGAVAISIQDVAGQVDLNSASVELLSALVVAIGADLGVTAERAQALAATIAVRREVNPFRLVEELASLRGMTSQLYRALRPHVTLYSGYVGLAREHVGAPLQARLSVAGGAAAFFGSQPSDRVFAVNVTARHGQRDGYRLETILEVRTGRRRLYRPLRWQGRPLREGSLSLGGAAEGEFLILSRKPGLNYCISAEF